MIPMWLLPPILQDVQHRVLPLTIWLPCDIKNSNCFWTLYTYETIVFLFSTIIYITCDIIFSGLLLKGCAQFDILQHRLAQLPKMINAAQKNNLTILDIRLIEKRILRQTARHHTYITKYIKNF